MKKSFASQEAIACGKASQMPARSGASSSSSLPCEYCFSHYVAIFFLWLTGYKLLFDDWRGYLIGGLALVWVANQYMSLYGHLRLDIRKEHAEIKEVEQIVQEKEERAA